ncbi:hypothetical protein GCM10007424_24890 [Flavobacterium suaedae]|uniref:Uncharacterized protein n=1 Tax=Flavobacterium suaedae TaxID=1767027 RepID=A0ABQ1K4I8_9FLAO|nr:DUF6549 family protein [Flavobacterium suaedae]GGB83901.1 hypothetical protein GCM10007424_24890 [Flavobacterium suaedae]
MEKHTHGLTYKKYIPYLLCSVLLVILLQPRCNSETRIKTNYQALNDSISYYKNRLGSQTATIKTLLADKETLGVLLTDKDKELQELIKEFASVKNVVKYKDRIVIDTIKVTYTDTLPYPDFERTGKIKNKWYSFRYKSMNDGFTLDSLTIPNEVTVITGVKRKWFLGKQTITTDVTSTNPYIKVTELKAAEVEVPTPVYKKWYVWLGVGILGGILVAN